MNNFKLSLIGGVIFSLPIILNFLATNNNIQSLYIDLPGSFIVGYVYLLIFLSILSFIRNQGGYTKLFKVIMLISIVPILYSYVVGGLLGIAGIAIFTSITYSFFLILATVISYTTKWFWQRLIIVILVLIISTVGIVLFNIKANRTKLIQNCPTHLYGVWNESTEICDILPDQRLRNATYSTLFTIGEYRFSSFVIDRSSLDNLAPTFEINAFGKDGSLEDEKGIFDFDQAVIINGIGIIILTFKGQSHLVSFNISDPKNYTSDRFSSVLTIEGQLLGFSGNGNILEITLINQGLERKISIEVPTDGNLLAQK